MEVLPRGKQSLHKKRGLDQIAGVIEHVKQGEGLARVAVHEVRPYTVIAGRLFQEGDNLRQPLAPLFEHAELMPQYVPLPAFPAVSRDLNLVVDEAVRWAQIAATVRSHGGPDLESLEYRDTYREAQRLGEGKKSFLFSIGLRSREGTLTSQQADGVRDRIVAACRQEHGAELRT